MAKVLPVYLHGQNVGEISPDPTNRKKINFTVSATYSGAANALTESFALIAGRAVDRTSASEFFGGYLPEGPNRTALAGKIPGLVEDNLFGMLQNYGVTMAGAVSVRTDDADEDVTPGYRLLGPRELKKKLQKAVTDHDLGSEPGSGRSAIAGFQPKILLARFDGEWHQPLRSAHSTHIVKPAPARRPATISNEFYSHQLSRHMGLASFGSELVNLNGLQYLAIERYDRRVHGFGDVEVFHQEDAAQILRLDWTQSSSKFQDPERPARKDRPTARTIAEMAGTLTEPGGAETWLMHLVYTMLVGNHDAHAKNVSILHFGDESRLADLYDAVPFLHINDDLPRAEQITDQLALSVNGEFRHHSVKRSDLQEEGESWGAMSSRAVSAIINETFEKFSAALEEVEPPKTSSPNLKDRLGYNLDRAASGAAISKPHTPLPHWGGQAQPRRGATGKAGNAGLFDEKTQSLPEVQF